MNESATVFDLTDAIGYFLGNGEICAEINSTKKIAQPGDIIISRLRSYLQELCLVPEQRRDFRPLLSTEFVVLRSRANNRASWLLPFLLSNDVQKVLHWAQTGSNHPRFSIHTLMNIPIPEKVFSLQDELSIIVGNAVRQYELSRLLYPEAEAELLERMEWKKIAKKPVELFYIEKFSEAQKCGRIDAEHFQPQYNRLLTHLKKIGACPLGEMINLIMNGFDCREWQEDGTPYIRVGDIQKGQISDECQKIMLESDEIIKDIQIREGDILFARKGTYGRTGVVNKKNASWIISSEIMRLRLNDKVKIIPEYLSLFIESRPGFLQVEQMVHGVSNFSIAQKDMYNILIYLPRNKNGSIDLEWQKKLADKVIRASKAKIEAQAMLDKAKKIVEDSINASI